MLAMVSISVIGPVLLSGVISCFTSGVVAVKVYHYYARFGKDPLPFKLLVGFCAVATLVSTITWPNYPYNWLVQNFGKTEIQATVHVANIVSNICIANIVVAVQSFFCWRIYKLSGAASSPRNLIVPTLITATSIAQFIPLVFLAHWIARDRKAEDWSHVYMWGIWWGCASGTGGLSQFIPHQFISFPSEAYIHFPVWFSTDLIITSSMTYLLLIKTRKHAGVSQSRHLFRGIVRRAAQTNLLSLIFQIAVVFILHFSAGLWFLPATASVAQIYTFSLLTSLSARLSHASGGSSENNPSTTPRRATDRVTVTVETERIDAVRVNSEEPSMYDVHFDQTVTHTTHLNTFILYPIPSIIAPV